MIGNIIFAIALFLFSGLYLAWLIFLFDREMDRCDPNESELARLWHQVHHDSKDSLDNMFFSKRIKLYKALKTSFPTGNEELREKIEQFKEQGCTIFS